jgi:predicted O-methyltransferase YrrM
VTLGGTALNSSWPRGALPKLVEDAVAEAVRIEFELCVHPATGRLLSVLAGGVPAGGLVGETGTGTGAGLAWMVSSNPTAWFISVEKDDVRVAAARRVFSEYPNVEIIHGDAGDLFERGPFDLLVHDGGWGSGKADPRRIDPTVVLKPNAVMTIDDYEPMVEWPPRFEGKPDTARIDWLSDPRFVSTEITVAEHMAVLVCRRRPEGRLT